MIPTFRLLLFLLLGSLLVAGVALAPALLWLALAYIVAVGALVSADYFVTARPAEIEIAPYDIHEARYHVKPLQRGDYSFGDVNIRYLSTLKTFVRQVRYPAEAHV